MKEKRKMSKSEPVLICLHDDIELTEESAATVAEARYRRGFTHGVAATLQAMGDGCTENDIQNWLMDLLYLWRYQAHNGKVEHPEWCPSKRKREGS
jgi:hypothetical protein